MAEQIRIGRKTKWDVRVGGRSPMSSELFPQTTAGRDVIRAFLDGFGEMAASLPLEQLDATGECVISLAGIEVPLNRSSAFELCELWAEGAADLRRRNFVLRPTRVERIAGWARMQRKRARTPRSLDCR